MTYGIFLRTALSHHSVLQIYSSPSLVIQEVLLLFPTSLQVDEEQYDAETDGTESGQEVERGGVVVRGHGINDGARNDGSDEGGGFADDIEEREEEKFFATGCNLGDL